MILLGLVSLLGLVVECIELSIENYNLDKIKWVITFQLNGLITLATQILVILFEHYNYY